MEEYKLYKVTVEKEFVIAMPSSMAINDIEGSVENIMIINADSLRDEGLSHVLVENIHHLGDLPGGWEGRCLPYLNCRAVNMPEELVNKTIEEYL